MPSHRSKSAAAVHDRDVSRIASIAVDKMGSVGLVLRAEVLRAVRSGRPVKPIIRRVMKQIVEPMSQALATASILGQVRAVQSAGASPRRLSLDRVSDPLGRWQSILDFATKRASIAPAAVRDVVRRQHEVAADAVVSMADLVNEKVQAAIRDSVGKGEHVKGTMDAVRAAFEAAGVTNAKPWLIETQARTQTQLAYAAGRLTANEDEAIQEILWGYEYVTVGDDRVRPNHAALDGVRLKKDDPRWKEIMPPNGWNCRCTVIEIYKGDELASETELPEEVEVDGEIVKTKADPGFEFSPLDIAAEQDMAVLESDVKRAIADLPPASVKRKPARVPPVPAGPPQPPPPPRPPVPPTPAAPAPPVPPAAAPSPKERPKKPRKPKAPAPAPTEPTPAAPSAPRSGGLAAAVVKRTENLGGGINTTMKVEFEDGTAGVFKPEDGVDEGFATRGGYKDVYKREAAAYIIDQHAGFGLVPETVAYTHKGKVGSMQRFVDGAQVAAMVPSEDRPKYTDDFFAFDFVIANGDRHHNNAMVTREGKWVAIDNGFTLRTNAQLRKRAVIFKEPAYATFEGMSPETVAKLRRIVDGEAALRSSLAGTLDKHQVDSVVERAKFLLDHPNLGLYDATNEFAEYLRTTRDDAGNAKP